MKFPKTLGACIDRAYTVRRERLAVEEKAKKLKAQETALKDHVIKTFPKGDLEGATGRIASASIGRTVVAHVLDWNKFMQWVGRTRAYDMVKRSVNDAAYRSRLDAEEAVPGVEPFHVTKLHVTKR